MRCGPGLRPIPDGGADALKDAAKLFYIFQQQGQPDAAKAVLCRLPHAQRWARSRVELRMSFIRWLGCLRGVQDFPRPRATTMLWQRTTRLPMRSRRDWRGWRAFCLTAPDQPLRVGAGNLALYKSIATMDRGPGYLNGILSLFFNSQEPAGEYASEGSACRALLSSRQSGGVAGGDRQALPDNAEERAELHARLMDAYAAYGENDAVIREGTAFLAQFPADARRVEVALSVGDVYSRTNSLRRNSRSTSLLKELAARADGVPLGRRRAAYSKQSTASCSLI
jgi:cellulose synthase operon protein C